MKNLLFILIVPFLLLSFTTFAIAETKYEEVGRGRLEAEGEKREARLEERKSMLSELRKDRCERLSERIDNRVEGYEKNSANHVKRFTNLEKRLNVLITKLEGLGLNTSGLEEDVVALKTLVAQYRLKYDLFVEEMKGVKEVACDEEGKLDVFKKNVEASREYLKEARNAAKTIREFIRGEIKNELLDLKEQAKELKLSEIKNEK